MGLRLKRIMSAMIAVLVAFGMMAAGTTEAGAASAKVKVYINNQVDKANHIYVGEITPVRANVTKGTKTATIKSVKVKDKSVAKVKIKSFKVKGKKHRKYYVTGKKPGKTKAIVKYKYNGKVKTAKITVTVVEDPDPLKSLEVNGKSIPLSGDTSFEYDAKCRKTKVRIKAVPSEGWEIAYVDSFIRYVKNNTPKYIELKNAKKKVETGRALTFAKKYKKLYTRIYLQNEIGVCITYEIRLHR